MSSNQSELSYDHPRAIACHQDFIQCKIDLDRIIAFPHDGKAMKEFHLICTNTYVKCMRNARNELQELKSKKFQLVNKQGFNPRNDECGVGSARDDKDTPLGFR